MGEDGTVYLYAKLDDGKDEKISLSRDEYTKAFKLTNRSDFEESDSIVEERLLGLSEDWMAEQEQGFESEAKTNGETKPLPRVQTGARPMTSLSTKTVWRT